VKLGPGASVGSNIGRLIDTGSQPEGCPPHTGSQPEGCPPHTLLDVAADELLRIFLEDLVDLVQEVVELGLELLPLLGGRGDLFDIVLVGAGGGRLLYLFSFCHG
jgi:hypothetical protein